MTRDEFELRDCCSLHASCDILYIVIYYSTHTRKNVIYADTWSDMNFSPCVHVCPLIVHGEQPMKMYTEVTLLYNNE